MYLAAAIFTLALLAALWMATLLHRHSPWVVYCWVPALIISGSGSLLMFMLFTENAHLSTAFDQGSLLPKLGLPIALLFLTPFPIVFLTSLIFRPKKRLVPERESK